MEKTGQKTRDIQFFSKKNGKMLCLYSRFARDYAKYLEEQVWVERYETGQPLEPELYSHVNSVGIRGAYFQVSWVSDFLIYFADGRKGIRKLVSVDDLRRKTIFVSINEQIHKLHKFVLYMKTNRFCFVFNYGKLLDIFVQFSDLLIYSLYIKITCDFSVFLPKDLPIAAVDLCALLGNALDNAMEAAERSADKKISVRCRTEKGLFLLCVENAADSGIKPDFTTTKTDRAVHGFGLSGMREIAERYGGSLETRAENGRFELIACLPLTP